jgi:hypothetical protein
MTENQEYNHSGKGKKTKQPTSLLVTSILSILSTGLTVIAGFQALATGKPSEDEIMKSRLQMAESLEQMHQYKMQYLEDVMRKLQIMMDAMYNNFVAYSLVAAFVASVGLFGVIMMLLKKEIGFHLYIIYSLLYVGQSYIFISPSDVSLFYLISNLLFSGLFIYIYSRSLTWFRN